MLVFDITLGRSTLQNELLGDLEDEFSDLPDLAEDLPLASLGQSIESHFSGQLGKQSSGLIAKMISSKMPAGFNQKRIQEHLDHSWGLGPLRQAAVLLAAASEEPASRLQSAEAAKEYLDKVISQYAISHGIDIGKDTTPRITTQVPTAVLNPVQLETFRDHQRDLTYKQFKVLAGHLEIDPSTDDKIAELESSYRELQTKIDCWGSEFAKEFEIGIQPCFDPKKARRYNSSWNLARQDVLELYFDAQNGRIQRRNERMSKTFRRIANCSDTSLHTLLVSLGVEALSDHRITGSFEVIACKLAELVASSIYEPPVFKFGSQMTAPLTTISGEGSIEYKEVDRLAEGNTMSFPEFLQRGELPKKLHNNIPYVHLKRCQHNEWKHDELWTETLFTALTMGYKSGFTYTGKSVLITGAGPRSIGAEVLKGLLMGGARVIVTTSRPLSATAKFYQALYDENAACGSELLVLPFNQGSKQDCEALIDHIFSDSGLGRDLDVIIPFAAISEPAVEIDGLEGESELAHRIMLVNVLRLLGYVVRNKRQRQINTRPTQVILPLSPNHGTFGGDGLYSESKIGLEALLNRFRSESWSDYLILCGASIGWTRGTALMKGNDIIAPAIEAHGVLTFSSQEMAFNLLVLITPPIIEICEMEPIWVDLNGGLQHLTDLNILLSEARSSISQTSEIRKAIKAEDLREELVLSGPLRPFASTKPLKIRHRSTLQIGFPTLPHFAESLMHLHHLQGMIDLSSTIVVVGFSELGPWGSARTRWEMEDRGEFTQEGYIEMAWIMNLIKHFDGEEKGTHYVGWVDAKTGKHVHDDEISETYSRQILEHSGIRLMEPNMSDGYDPGTKEYLHEIAVEEDLPEFDATFAGAEAFKLRHGSNANIRKVGNSDGYKVKIKRGAHILVPKAVPCDGLVASQMPTGWDAVKYGVPQELISQVDPVTLYTLCCASEALYSAGIIDSLEIFKHMHISELGNFIGSMMGGITKTRHMYKDRYLDKEVQSDVMAETYLNTSAAWVNMLLLGSAGPIKTPTGACATGIESVDSGSESILSGKTRMCFVGGTDDFQEDESYAFSTMKATSNAREELSKGRLPSEMSRPTTDTRAGFVESQGCGIQILTTAELALEMGLPIYTVIASSAMAADKISRSVPSPGQGVVSFARESLSAKSSPLLDISYRREQMETSITEIRHWEDVSLQKLSAQTELNQLPRTSEFFAQTRNPPRDSRCAIKAAATIRIREARKLWTNDFRKQDPTISPLRASLAVWNLTIDDLSIASLHGTSTKANDKNESEILNKQMTHLGRTPGRPLLAICQKSLTGHAKAPAAAFMLNGCMQSINSGIIPGNRNADNVDEDLRQYEHLVYPTKSMHSGDIKAFSLTSFGFGQKGGQIIGVAPKYLFASLEKDVFEAYTAKVSTRKRFANRAYLKAFIANSIVKVHAAPPYDPQDETNILLDPLARISETASGDLRFIVAPPAQGPDHVSKPP